MVYIKTTWVDNVTPISQTNLNNLEKQYDAVKSELANNTGDLWTQLKTADGAGSGLDADKLNGKDLSELRAVMDDSILEHIGVSVWVGSTNTMDRVYGSPGKAWYTLYTSTNILTKTDDLRKIFLGFNAQRVSMPDNSYAQGYVETKYLLNDVEVFSGANGGSCYIDLTGYSKGTQFTIKFMARQTYDDDDYVDAQGVNAKVNKNYSFKIVQEEK